MKEVKIATRTREYEAGYDAAINGPNLSNCSIRHFSTPEKTKEWERGNEQGKKDMEKLNKMLKP